VAEYKAVKPEPSLDSVEEGILKRYKDDPNSMTWADLYALETATLKEQPYEVVKRRAWSLRDKYREVAGPLEYNAYIASHPPNENELNINKDEVRADLGRVLGTLHWNYSLIPLRERIRGSIINRIGLGILVVGLTLGLVIWRCLDQNQIPIATLIVVAFAGCLGGFVSMQRRIGQVPSDGDPLLSIFQLNSGLSTLYLAPVSGAIFAILLYFMFSGKLLDGGLFPDMSKVLMFKWNIKEWRISEGANEGPVGAFGKLLVWSFIAGFAERFVPDILDRLVARGQASNQPTPSPAPPFSGQSSSSRTGDSTSKSSDGEVGKNGIEEKKVSPRSPEENSAEIGSPQKEQGAAQVAGGAENSAKPEDVPTTPEPETLPEP
jgi:hypothetical protein